LYRHVQRDSEDLTEWEIGEEIEVAS